MTPPQAGTKLPVSAAKRNPNWLGALAKFGVITGTALSAVGALAPTAAEAKPNTKIVIGRSIGGVSLGQTEAQVKQKVGKPTVKSGSNHGVNLAEWDYGGNPGNLSVAFGNIDEGVVLVEAHYKKYKTNKGVGIGSTLAQIQTAYPDAKCEFGSGPTGEAPDGPPTCVIQSEYKGGPAYTSFIQFPPVQGVGEIALSLTK